MGPSYACAVTWRLTAATYSAVWATDSLAFRSLQNGSLGAHTPVDLARSRKVRFECSLRHPLGVAK